MCLFRVVDSSGQTVDFYLSESRDREAAKIFLKWAMKSPDNRGCRVLARDGLRSYPAALRELEEEGHVNGRYQQRTRRYANNRVECDHRHVKCRLRYAGATNGSDGVATDSQGAGARDYAGQFGRSGERGATPAGDRGGRRTSRHRSPYCAGKATSGKKATPG